MSIVRYQIEYMLCIVYCVGSEWHSGHDFFLSEHGKDSRHSSVVEYLPNVCQALGRRKMKALKNRESKNSNGQGCEKQIKSVVWTSGFRRQIIRFLWCV